VTGRRGTRLSCYWDDLKETRGHWKLNGKHKFATLGDLALRKGMNLSYNRLGKGRVWQTTTNVSQKMLPVASGQKIGRPYTDTLELLG